MVERPLAPDRIVARAGIYRYSRIFEWVFSEAGVALDGAGRSPRDRELFVLKRRLSDFRASELSRIAVPSRRL